MKKRILGGLAAAAMLTGGLAFSSAGVVSAHHPIVSGVATCQSDGTYQITWTATSWEQNTKQWKITSPVALPLGGGFQPNNTPFTWSDTAPGTSTSKTISVAASWNNGASGTRDGSVRMDGKCKPAQPDSKVTYGEWLDGTFKCGDTSVTQTRTVTTTPYKWTGQAWVLDTENATSETETQTRALTEAEIESCRPEPKVTETEWQDGSFECGATSVTQTRTVTTTPYKWTGQAWVLDTENATSETETQTRALTEAEIESCRPEPKVTETEWQDGSFECGATSVTQTRTVTTTPYVWNGEEFVLDTENATSETETRTRELTADEIEPCPTQPPATTQPPTTVPPTSIVEALPPVETPTTTDVSAAGPTVPAVGGLPATGSDGAGTMALIALLATSLGGVALVVARRRNVTG